MKKVRKILFRIVNFAILIYMAMICAFYLLDGYIVTTDAQIYVLCLVMIGYITMRIYSLEEPCRLYIDMDGTLAEWREGAKEEDLYKKGYFYTLKPLNSVYGINELIKSSKHEECITGICFFLELAELLFAMALVVGHTVDKTVCMIALAVCFSLIFRLIQITALNRPQIDIYVLSHVLGNRQAAEKRLWLKKYMPKLKEEQIIFVPYGDRKTDYIDRLSEKDILMDDFSKNLRVWKQEGGRTIKAMNGINGTNGTYTGYKISVNDRNLSDKVFNFIKKNA